MSKKFISLEGYPPATMYSQAVRVKDTIYVAGQLALDKDRNVVGRDDCRVQAEQAFQNHQKVLQGAGASLEDVVKLTSYYINPSN